ncbi:glycosyltransferase family 4 protein [Sphingobacterium corticibacter]|uniref:Glycosyltransferase family 1 protein n=1 Tax=Sphingobacterium corticibacter TaxID=2171749 RepID=A0A2T8HHK3_9SPHI|nr:glycosyltransferase family 4 protein [Sphingobacterium corticibacter]PVH24883.1 glycosyltransferase family 1 protein [Sphingobacterium corticibacter]
MISYMRVLFVHNYYQDLGGEDVVFHQEMKALSEVSGYEVFSLTYQNEKGWKGLWQFGWSAWNIFAAKKLRDAIRRIRPDVIHFHNTQYAAGPILIRTAKKAGIPVVMSLHNFRLLCPSATLFYRGKLFTDSVYATFPWKAIRNRVLDHSFLKTVLTAVSYWMHRKIGTWKMVDRFLVLADFSKDLFVKSSLDVPAEHIVVKPNFVNIPAPDILPERQKNYLYVGRVSEEKGILELLNALKNTDYPLRIVGSGPLEEQVKEIVNNTPNFSYVGALPKEAVYTELLQCKALIVPSVCYEGGTPLTIIEGMMLHTPIIASDIGAIADAVKEGETGYLFQPTDAASIVHAIDRFESDSTAAHQIITARAAEKAQRMHSQKRIMALLQQEYDQVCARNT